VSFAAAMQFLTLRAAKHAIFSGCFYKTEVLQEPLIIAQIAKSPASREKSENNVNFGRNVSVRV